MKSAVLITLADCAHASCMAAYCVLIRYRFLLVSCVFVFSVLLISQCFRVFAGAAVMFPV